MKLDFTRNGKQVTVTADDEDIILVEMKSGTEDFVMVRLKPGALKSSLEADSKTWRL